MTPAIVRRPACELKDDTDLGERLVTVDVGTLSAEQIERALAAGAAHAQRLLDAGTIAAAAMCLRGRARTVERSGMRRFRIGLVRTAARAIGMSRTDSA